MGMYRGYEILSTAAFRVTRNSNLVLPGRRIPQPVGQCARRNCTIAAKGTQCAWRSRRGADAEIVDRLRMNFELDDAQVFPDQWAGKSFTPDESLLRHRRGPISSSTTFSPKNCACTANRQSLRRAAHHDILLHHPFDSYDAVEEFRAARFAGPRASSPWSKPSTGPVTTRRCSHALTEAAQTKEVTVVVELMARFDEASNIRWARDMEDAGVQRLPRHRRSEDPLQAGLMVRRDPRRRDRAAMLTWAPATTTPYRPLLHRCQPAHRRSRNHLRVHSVFRYLTAHSESDDYAPLAGGAAYARGKLLRTDPPRGRTRSGWAPGAHHRQDELAARSERH